MLEMRRRGVLDQAANLFAAVYGLIGLLPACQRTRELTAAGAQLGQLGFDAVELTLGQGLHRGADRPSLLAHLEEMPDVGQRKAKRLCVADEFQPVQGASRICTPAALAARRSRQKPDGLPPTP